MKNQTFKAPHILINLFYFCLLFTSCKNSIDEKIEPHGFTIHMGSDSLDIVKDNMGDYPISASNWKFRDNNSLFIHIVGDSLGDDKYLFPGYSLYELDLKTQENGTIYWKETNSLVWVSSVNEDVLIKEIINNEELKGMINELAYNQYKAGSYANITGSSEVFEFIDFEQSPYFGSKIKYTKPTYNENYAGIFNTKEIDYAKPELYLKNGYQSNLEDEHLEEIKKEVGNINNSLDCVIKIMDYYHRNFDSSGIDDYRISANDIFKMKRIAGCTEQSLIITSILRSLGFPTIQIATVSLEAAKDTNPPSYINSGHYITEVYVENQWYLLDGNGRICKNYDPHNPYIIRKFENDIDEGFVIGKGLDNWDIGLNYKEAYTDMCIEFNNRLDEVETYTKAVNYSIMEKY